MPLRREQTVPSGRLLMTMKTKAYIKAVIAVWALWAVSCSKTELCPDVPQDEITLEPAAEAMLSKAVITGTSMPDGFHIWLSTYLTDEKEPTNERNYFTDIEYAKSGAVWRSTPAHYWPMQGVLDFLGIATDPALGATFSWNSTRNTSQVDVNVPDTYDNQTEVLYAASYPLDGVHVSVPMSFRHSQAMLTFRIRTDVTDLIRVTDITVKDVYTDGILTVHGSGQLSAEWDFSGSTPADRTVHKPSASYYQEPTGSYVSFGNGILLPEQQNKVFVISYRQRANTGIAWDSDLVVDQTFTFDDTFRLWQMGKQYFYNIDFSLTGITVTPDITPWN